MKKVNLVFTVFVLLFSAASVSAQDAKGDEEVVRKLFQAEHRSIVSDNLKMTDAQSTAFWGIYDQYEVERKIISEKRLAVLKKFIDNIDSSNVATSTEVMNTTLDNQSENLKLQKKYFKKISKSVSPLVAARFIQIEQTINAKINWDVLSQLPLAGD